MTEWSCNICEHRGAELAAERAEVRSNVRAFAHERFRAWRCRQCGSIHAQDEVDLAFYYANYPFHTLPLDPGVRLLYTNLLARLRAAGLKPEHTILDYGCGGGTFIKYLRLRGYQNAYGFDEYSESHRDRSVLDRKYDFVISQDVIEHVPSPHGLLDEFERLVVPGGTIVIGTPNAAALSLTEPERTLHALHMPYHRHICSKQALIAAASKHDLQLQRYYPTHYGNTLFPFLNTAFLFYYMRTIDNTLDVLFGRPKVLDLLLRLPLTLFWGLFGYWFAPETDVMFVFRRPEKPAAQLPVQRARASASASEASV